MPASDQQQGNLVLRFVPFLFWGGVGLAPVAAVLFLVGQSTSLLRVGAVLALAVVVLIGLSVSLQRSAGGVPPDVEDMVLDELDALREDVREDITVAARATHKALGEKVVGLHETVDGLRAQVEHLRAQLASGPPAPQPHPTAVHTGAHGHVGGGVVRHTETVQVTTRQTIVDPNEARGTVYGSNRSSEAPLPRRGERAAPDEWRQVPDDWSQREERTVSARAGVPSPDSWSGPERQSAHGRAEPERGEPEWPRRSARSDSDRSDRDRADRDRADRDRADRDRADRDRADRDRADRDRADRDRADRDRPARADGEWSGRAGADRPAPRMVEDHAEESWTEKLLRERFAKSASQLGEMDRGSDWSSERVSDRSSDRPVGRRRAPEHDDDDDRITGVRTGDRWASVRSDERGRELRMGERRAAVHADESGTEVRIEDRWAAVLREESRSRRRESGPDRQSGPDWQSDRERDRRDGDRRDSDRWGSDSWEEPRDERPALPAGAHSRAVPEPRAADWSRAGLEDSWGGGRSGGVDSGGSGRRSRRAADDDEDGYRWSDDRWR
jgi:hypothetical protein